MKIVLIGNQNSGKSTIFNLLTNSNQKVGNWSGVTIDTFEKNIKNTNHILVDLPGIYSLSPYSIEEEVTVNYLLNNDYDYIINVIDVNLLERSLYLTINLLELNKNMLIILTMTDKTNNMSNIINILSSKLNITVIDINDIKKNINILFSNFKNNNINNYNIIKNNSDLSYQRYQYIEKIIKDIKINNSNNYLDKVLLNPILGIVVFILIIFITYYLSIGVVGNYTCNYLDKINIFITDKISYILSNLKIYNFLKDLIINGIISSFFAILKFIPQLLILFVITEVLNQSGYIVRISFLLEGLLNKIGLSGKSLMSFMTGFSCSVPGIMQSRIIQNEGKRNKTIILTPFIPCSAKLPIILMISNYFYPNYIFIFFIYLMSIMVVILSSLILKKIYKISEDEYIMELPRYHLVKLNYILKEVINKIKEFIKRTGSLIIISSIIVWVLLSFSTNLQYQNNIEYSLLYFIGKKISYLFYPFLGQNNWILSVSIIEGLIAKEQVVATLSVISHNQFFNYNLLKSINKVSSLSFLTFNLFSIPCINTIITMKNELNSFKKLLFTLFFQFFIAFIISTIIYQVGNLW